MTLDDLFGGLFKAPMTKENAISLIKGSATAKATVEEMAFRQVVANVLILSGLVSETDFGLSLKHFEEQLYDQLAEELMATIEEYDREKSERPSKSDDSDDSEATRPMYEA